MPRRDFLSKQISDEIDRVIAERLAKVGDPAIRKAIEESLYDQVYANMGDEIAAQTRRIVEESLSEVIASIQSMTQQPGKAKKPAAAKPDLASSFGQNGKAPSGSKTSARKAPPSTGSGSKGSAYGGKAPPRPRSYGGKGGYGGK